MLLMLTATRWGIGLSPDSATYIAGTHGLLEGHGFSSPVGGGRWQPITAWPPFYSMVLAMPAWLGVDPWVGARWLNVALLGANTIVVALLLRKILGKGTWLPLVGAFLFLLSSDALSAHGWAWSDPLFLLLGLLGLLSLDVYLEKGRRAILVVSAALMGLCVYTRYAGIAFLITGLVVLGLRAARSRPRGPKVLDLVVFGAFACLPVMAWTFRNLAVSQGQGGELPTIRGMSERDWMAVYRTISLWFLPGRIAEPARGMLMAVVAAALILLTAAALVRPSKGPSSAPTNLVKIVGLFVLVYPIVLIGSRLFLRAFNIRDARYLLPLYVGLVVLLVYDVAWLHARLSERLPRSKAAEANQSGRRLLNVGWVAAFVAMGAFHGTQSFKWARESFSEGLGYANFSWHSSRMLEYLRRLPEDEPVISNAYDAIYILTGRETYPFPRETDQAGIPAGSALSEEWSRLNDLVQDRGAVVAAFRSSSRAGLADLDEIRRRTELCLVEDFQEAGAYRRCRQE
jgi:hypothetical protein